MFQLVNLASIKRTRTLIATLASAVLMLAANASAQSDIVLKASSPSAKAGKWAVQTDSDAYGGAKIRHPDAGAAKIATAAVSPANYFEFTFTATAGVPYHLWVHGRADGDDPYNDSVFVQFSGSVDQSGAPVFRIGTTDATPVVLEDCGGCGVSAWGWQDNGYGTGVLGPTIAFERSGRQTIRIQRREDGISIDQIVLSPVTYLTTSPGAPKNDGRILPPTP
jgi:hypothetical protein